MLGISDQKVMGLARFLSQGLECHFGANAGDVPQANTDPGPSFDCHLLNGNTDVGFSFSTLAIHCFSRRFRSSSFQILFDLIRISPRVL